MDGAGRMDGADGRDGVGIAGHIALLLPNLEPGGAERVQVTLADEFRRRGHRVTFVLMERRGALLDALDPAHGVVALGTGRLRAVPRPLVALLRSLRPDALLASMWPLTGIAAVAARMTGTRAVLSEHTDLRIAPAVSRAERRLLRLAGRRVYGLGHATVAVSVGVAEGIEAVARVPRERIAVIPNPIPPPGDGAPGPGDRDLIAWWRGGERALVAVGALKPAKAYDDMLAALAEVRRTLDARLVVVGEGPLRAELEGEIARLDLADGVRLAGFRADPAPLVRSADLFVLSSRREGFGNVIVEAMGCGVPVVATDCRSGPREILAGGRHGTLAPPADPAALAAAIRLALDAPVDADALRRRAADFAPQGAAEAYLRLLLP